MDTAVHILAEGSPAGEDIPAEDSLRYKHVISGRRVASRALLHIRHRFAQAYQPVR